MAVIGKTMAMTGTVEFDQKRRPRLYAADLEHCHFRCESTLQETRGGSRHVDVQSLDSGMRKSRFTDEQVIGFLKQAEAGMSVGELCRMQGFSDATFYKWRAKFGGMQVEEAKRLRELEAENGRLKKLLAEAHLDIEALKVGFGVKR